MKMRRSAVRLGLSTLICCLAAQAPARAQVPAQAGSQARAKALTATTGGITSVEVFANSAMNVSTPTTEAPYVIKVYRVDGLALIEAALNKGVPSNEAQAQAYFAAQQDEIKKRYAAQAANAANGITRALYYKVDRIPAVVINQRTVVYGVTNVEQAVALYQDARERGRVK